MSRWHRRVTTSCLPSACGCLFPPGTSCWFHRPVWAPVRSPARAVSGTDTGQPSAAPLREARRERSLFPSFPPPESYGPNPVSTWARLALLSEFPGPAGSGLSCSGGGVVGGSGRSAVSFPLWKQSTVTASPAALFARQAMLNRISSACGHKVCTRARVQAGYRHTYRGISALECSCWGYSSQGGTGTLAPRLRMWLVAVPSPAPCCSCSGRSQPRATASSPTLPAALGCAAEPGTSCHPWLLVSLSVQLNNQKGMICLTWNCTPSATCCARPG